MISTSPKSSSVLHYISNIIPATLQVKGNKHSNSVNRWNIYGTNKTNTKEWTYHYISRNMLFWVMLSLDLFFYSMVIPLFKCPQRTISPVFHSIFSAVGTPLLTKNAMLDVLNENVYNKVQPNNFLHILDNAGTGHNTH
jgi:hypothetical protein